MKKLEIEIDTEKWTFRVGKDMLALPPSEARRRIQIWAGSDNNSEVDVVFGYANSDIENIIDKENIRKKLDEFIRQRRYVGRIQFGPPPDMISIGTYLVVKRPVKIVVK